VEDNAEIKATKDKVEDLIAKITKSPKSVKILKEKSGGTGLVKPVRTRWIYWFYVFERLLKLKRYSSLIN
jgi:hypothetical protein